MKTFRELLNEAFKTDDITYKHNPFLNLDPEYRRIKKKKEDFREQLSELFHETIKSETKIDSKEQLDTLLGEKDENNK